MQQVLFHIPVPFLESWFPGGIPIHGFGVMLFLCFLICTGYAARRVKPLGLTADRMQDLGIVLFLTGIVGARITFMIQYHVPISKFFNIWEGGIVLYGSLIGGFIGYWLFYFIVLKPLNISTWKLADAIAPAIILGVMLGRVGCLLNGCCYGEVASDSCPSIGFPLLTAPVRQVVVDENHYQTTTGFTVKPASTEDIRSVVQRIEPESAAEHAGLQPGDKILEINGKSNGAVLLLSADKNKIEKIAEWFTNQKLDIQFFDVFRPNERGLKVIIPQLDRINQITREAEKELQISLSTLRIDAFRDMISKWPKGRHDLELTVDRSGQSVKLPSFTPRSLGLHPTQIYESISMFLLTLFLISFHPFRRHDGQVFVVLILCYALHRFLNEMLRNDTPVEMFGMTLSQLISVAMVIAAFVLECWLRLTQPRRASIASS